MKITVTYLGDDSNQASATWMNTMTKEQFVFPINQPVDVNPAAPENRDRIDLAKHIITKLTSINHPHFRLTDGRTGQVEAPKSAPPPVVEPMDEGPPPIKSKRNKGGRPRKVITIEHEANR